MKNKIIASILVSILALGTLSGCGNSSQENEETIIQSEEIPAETEAAAKTAEEEANACYEAGLAYLYGLEGQEINLEAAYTNFDQALEKGKTEANFYLGVLYDSYNYPEHNFEKAKAYYEAAGDNPYAQLALGLLYLNGQGVEADAAKAQELFNAVIANDCVEGYLGSASIASNEKDYATALEYYNKATEGQEQLYISSAMNSIGFMYDLGFGVEQDYDMAMVWYEKAANLGNATAINNIGWLYLYGLGVEQDYDKAMEWYKKAADLGSVLAINNIGGLYHNGLGVEQDYDKAMEWYKKAADLGDATAMNNIGFMYDEGLGVEQDYDKAMEWYEKAADLGSTLAINNIGWLYLYGLGVEQDYNKAMMWYEKAADLGDATAINNIGYMYEKGLGVKQDSAKAKEWYDKAEAAK